MTSLFSIASVLLAAAVCVDVPCPPAGRDAAKELESVRNRVRKMSADEKLAGVVVRLSSGVWNFRSTLEFTAEDSGTSGAPVEWRGAETGGTVLRFSDEIALSEMRPVIDPSVRSRLDQSAAEFIREIDVSKLPIRDPRRSHESMNRPYPFPEVYFDGVRMPFARWPNSFSSGDEEWTTMASILEPGGSISTGGAFDAMGAEKRTAKPVGGLFAYSGDRPSRWRNAPEILLQGFWAFDWSNSMIPVKEICVTSRTIRLALPHMFGVKQGNPSPRRWRAVYLLEEIDSPGEHCFDMKAGKLYFYPPCASGRLAVACRKSAFFSLEGASNLRFSDLGMEECLSTAITARRCTNVEIKRVKFRNIRDKAVDIVESDLCGVRGCDVCETGCGGIAIGGGNRKTLTGGTNTVEDCLIRGYSRLQLCYASAITASGVHPIVRHCEISDAPHMAVAFNCNDGVFEYNVISNVVQNSDDAGAFYKGRNPSMRGNVIRWNIWKDIGAARGHGTAAIYLDDGDGGERIEGNLFVRCGYFGKGSFGTVFVHGGYSNVVRNCVFVDCERPLGSKFWDDERWGAFVRSPLWRKKLREDVDITGETYLSHYPELAGFMDPQPGALRGNLALDNVIVNCKSVCSGRFATNSTDVVFTSDPGFVDTARGDYAFRRNAPVRSFIPSFKDIPMSKIGLLTRR